MKNNGMFYTNANDYETKEDMMNDFIALRMFDMAKDKEIERLNNIISNLEIYVRKRIELCYELGCTREQFDIWNSIEMRIKELKGDSSNE